MREETQKIIADSAVLRDERIKYMDSVTNELKEIQECISKLNPETFYMYTNKDETETLGWCDRSKKIYFLTSELDGSIPILELPFRYRQIVYIEYIQKFLKSLLKAEEQELKSFKEGNIE